MSTIAVAPAGELLMIDAREVARLLGVSERTIFNLRKAGRIPAPVTFGRLVKWSRYVIEEWVRRGATSPTAPTPAQE